ncbi:MAG: hypothetical protein ICV56_08330 [Nitrososphaeraceae archaeon]|nr:hypothetical protein [Nitrososphaeraceae archaeon]
MLSEDHLIRIILGRRGYGFIAALLSVLFAIFFYILSPSNFSSFSDTLRYFISGLSTLLAVVVSFNTLALRNQLNNMPNSIEVLERQLDKISNLLQPVINQMEKDQEQESSSSYEKSATLYYTDAMKSMLQESKNYAESVLKNYDSTKKEFSNKQVNNFRNICTDFIKEIGRRLSLYEKYKNPYYLVIISTTDFVERMRFNQVTHSNEQTKALFDISKRLHIIRNISVRIYIRNSLTKLSFEMLMSTIPIITFVAIISAISNYEQYNTLFLRLLFAASSSIVIMPFLQLFVRTMPVLAVIHSSSSIPFTQKD